MKRVLFAVVAIAGIAITLSSCSTFNVIKQEDKYVKANIYNHPDIQHNTLTVDGNRLHYAVNGDPNKPALVIIHGTPSNWEQYARYLLNDELLTHYRMIVIDRPGWGASTLNSKQAITSFEEQAKIISALIAQLREQNNQQPVVLMGHSLGASLAPRIAMDYPEMVDGLLLFAGTLDVKLAAPRWYHYAAAAPLANYVIGREFSRSNKEMFALPKDIAAMSGRWHEIQAQTLAVQGMKDFLVAPANSDFIEANFNPEKTQVVRLNKDGHLFPMTRRDDVVAWALQLLDRIQTPQG